MSRYAELDELGQKAVSWKDRSERMAAAYKKPELTGILMSSEALQFGKEVLADDCLKGRKDIKEIIREYEGAGSPAPR